MNVLVKNLGHGIKNVKINDPKTYNSLSFVTLKSLLNILKKLYVLLMQAKLHFIMDGQFIHLSQIKAMIEELVLISNT